MNLFGFWKTSSLFLLYSFRMMQAWVMQAELEPIFFPFMYIKRIINSEEAGGTEPKTSALLLWIIA